jgi:chloramphenicol O-acetyltransferase
MYRKPYCVDIQPVQEIDVYSSMAQRFPKNKLALTYNSSHRLDFKSKLQNMNMNNIKFIHTILSRWNITFNSFQRVQLRILNENLAWQALSFPFFKFLYRRGAGI